jgi:hypothetical protein
MSASATGLSRFYLLLAALTLALFVFANLRSPLVNEDGVLYLLLAERIGTEGLSSAFALYDRPFYPWLIAAIHAVSGLSLTHSALCLDATFCVLLALAFAEFCRLLYDDRGVLPWAALLILAHPKLNNYFGFIVRDIGYWALLFVSFCAWLRHLGDARTRWLLVWAPATLLAAAQRPEALLFGLLLPPVLLFAPRRARDAALPRVLLAWGLVFGAMALALLLVAALDPGTFAQPMRDANDVPAALWRDIPAHFLVAVDNYAREVLDPHSRDVAALSLAGGLLTILVAKILNGLGPLQVLLLAHGLWRSGVAPVAANRRAYATMLAGAALIAAAFVAYRHFLDTRYVMLAAMLMLAPAARSLQSLAARVFAGGGTGRAAFVATALLLACLDLLLGLDRPKPYLNECALWLRANLPAGSPVFANDKQLAWTSAARWDYQTTHDANLLIAQGRVPLAGNAYWIIHVKRGEDELARQLQAYRPLLTPLHRCEDPKGSVVEVFTQAAAP